jgi:hypothetical protein
MFYGLWFRVQTIDSGLGSRVDGSGGLGFRVLGLWFRV